MRPKAGAAREPLCEFLQAWQELVLVLPRLPPLSLRALLDSWPRFSAPNCGVLLALLPRPSHLPPSDRPPH